jgi:putative ABC transport system permease protein
MKFAFQVREAWLNLKVSLLRSMLAILGILVGTASVVAMISGGELATRQVLSQFKALGTDLLAVQIYPKQSSGAGSGSSLPYSIAVGVKTASPNIQLVAPYINVFSSLSFQGQSINGSVMGATQNIASLIALHLKEGRFVQYFDKYEHYVVVGDSIYQKIKALTVRDPVGQQLQIGTTPFTIIGVLQPWVTNPFIFEDLNYAAIIPIQSSITLSKNAQINNILLQLLPNADIQDTEDRIKNYFEQNAAGQQIYFQSAQQLVNKMKSQQNTLTVFLAFVGGISLFVGGIGVMNIMLVSVTERKREIGIRKAIGAKQRDIQSLFLIESVILSLFGGILGVIAGVFISFLIAFFKGWGFTLFLIPPSIGFVVSVFIGIFFGFYPAYQASKLNAIQSLRAD